MGERLESLAAFPFMNRGEVRDFHNALADGIYIIADYGRGFPGNPGIEYGILLIFKGNNSNETYTLQQAFNIYSPKISYWRCFSTETGEGVEWNTF